MNRYDRRAIALAAGLSALAGYVDAVGFIETGGFFVSFMSGNSTRFGVGLARGSAAFGFAAVLIGCFVGGVVAGSLAGYAAGDWRRPAVLVLVAALLGVSALSADYLKLLAVALAAAAMGAENAVFERDGDVQISLTYVTGTLVKFGQRLAAALRGGDRLAWAPYLLLWAGLAAGAFTGAAVHPLLGLHALWPAAAVALLGALAATRA